MPPTLPPKLSPGHQAPDFALPTTDGRVIRLADECPRVGATVVMFLCNHCPYVKAYIPRLIQLQRRYDPAAASRQARGAARFIGICSNDAQAYPEDSFEQMQAAAQQWGMNFPYAHDEDQSVARAYGAQRTPEIFVLDANGICRYEGGIDDHYQDAAQVTQQPLRDAIEAVVHGRPVDQPQTYAIGCTLKWKNR